MRSVSMTKGVAVAALLAACGGGLASMPSGPKPAWVGASEISQYPEGEFLTGVGMTTVKGDDMTATQQAADAAARVELTKKLEVSVSSEFTSFQAETQKDGVSSSTQSVSELTREAIRGFELEGVDIKERWLDAGSGVAYALAVWPRARAEAQLKAKLSDAEAASRKAEAEGDANAASNAAVALKQYVQALGTASAAQRNAILLRAITGKPTPVADIAPLRAKLDKLLDAVTVKAEEGDGQRVTANAAAPRPLVVRASFGNAPLAGLPLAFELQGGQVDAAAQTDAQGLGSARVSNVGGLASGEASASARVDWAKLAGLPEGTSIAGTRPFEVKFRLVPKSMSTTRILVKIFERIQGAESASLDVVQSAATQALAGAGFQVSDGAALVERFPAQQLLSLDPATFQKEARDLADVVVIGEAVSDYSSTISGDVMIHRARMNLRAVDLGTGKVVASLNFEAKGRPAQGQEKAGRKAIEAVAKTLSESDLTKQVRAGLGF